MVVPYGDPRPPYFRRNAFDIGEYGIGMLANSLELGCDCLGEIRYFDVVSARQPGSRDNQERDLPARRGHGLLWKHSTGAPATGERDRGGWSVSFIATVGNYEYGFFWYLYQDGNIQLEVKLTGMISNGATARRGDSRNGGRWWRPVSTRPIHQHFFNVRMDMMVDGRRQLGLRSEHRLRSEWTRKPVQQRVPCGGGAPGERGRRAADHQSAVSPLLDDRQSVVDQSTRPTGGYKLIPVKTSCRSPARTRASSSAPPS